MSSKLNLLVIVAAMLAILSEYNFALPVADGPYDIPDHLPKGYHEAPHSDYHEPHHGYPEKLGRVKIQAYRGPSVPKKDGYHKEYFAPFGHYQTQPADAKKKKHY